MAGWATPRANKWGEPDSHGKTVLSSTASTEKRGALNPEFSLWLMGFPLASGQVLRAAGNAIVPQLAAEFIRAFMDFAKRSPRAMLSDDPNELRGWKRLADELLNRAVADLVNVVEHNGRHDPGMKDADAAARAWLKDEVIDWFFNPHDGPWSLNVVCSLLGYEPQAWGCSVQQYLDNPGRRGIPNHWRKLNWEMVIKIHIYLKAGVPKKEIAQMFRVDRTLITKIANGRRWQKQRAA